MKIIGQAISWFFRGGLFMIGLVSMSLPIASYTSKLEISEFRWEWWVIIGTVILIFSLGSVAVHFGIRLHKLTSKKAELASKEAKLRQRKQELEVEKLEIEKMNREKPYTI